MALATVLSISALSRAGRPPHSSQVIGSRTLHWPRRAQSRARGRPAHGAGGRAPWANEPDARGGARPAMFFGFNCPPKGSNETRKTECAAEHWIIKPVSYTHLRAHET